MEVQQNSIARDWTVVHEGWRFHVNFMESDGQTLALLNRENWEIAEKTEDGMEEFSVCAFNDSSPVERKQAEETARIIDELVAFCIENWENEFMREIQENMKEQRKDLERQGTGEAVRAGADTREAPTERRERKRDTAGACRLIDARAIRARAAGGPVRGDAVLSCGVRRHDCPSP